MGQPASRRTAEAGRKALGAIGGLNLHAERPQHVDAPGSTRAAVLWPPRHGRRDVAVDEPVTSLDLMELLVLW